MGVPIRELEQHGLMPPSWQQGMMGALGGAGAAAMTCTVSAQMNVGWDYERQDWVQGAPAMEELPPPQLPQQPEEPPEVEELAGIDEYQPLKLESHESFSARLSRKKGTDHAR
jgi:hypothetical protein